MDPPLWESGAPSQRPSRCWGRTQLPIRGHQEAYFVCSQSLLTRGLHPNTHTHMHTYTLYFQSEPVIFWSLNVLKNRKLSHQPKEMNFQTLSLKMFSLITSPLDH